RFIQLYIKLLPLSERHLSVFFFTDTATTEIYTLSLHDALPIFLWRQISRIERPRGDHSRSPLAPRLLLEGTVRRYARRARGRYRRAENRRRGVRGRRSAQDRSRHRHRRPRTLPAASANSSTTGQPAQRRRRRRPRP